MSLSEEFRSIVLSSKATERAAHAFLKRYPYVLIHLFNKSWNFYKIFSEFRLGTDFRADFVVISANSGYWDVHFIELEGPHDSPYTQSSTPSRKLNWALDKQMIGWTLRMNIVIISRIELAKAVKPLRAPAQNHLREHNTTADIEIGHSKTSKHFEYHVIIGNSRRFTEAHRKAHRRHSHWHGVLTYDRVYNAMCDLEARYNSFEDQVKVLSSTGYQSWV